MKNEDIASKNKGSYTEKDMALGIRAVSDICFKYIFGTEESAELLKDFINAVLSDAGFPLVREVTVVNPCEPGTYLDENISVIDTRVKDETWNNFGVVVQVRSRADYQDRSLYHWAKAYTGQLPEGHEYAILRRVISISILDFKLFPDHIPFHSCFMLRENTHRDSVLSQDCTMHYLETPKLKKEPMTEVEKWLYLLLHAGKEDKRMDVLIDQNEYFRKAMDRYTYFAADEQARLAYEARQKFLHDQASYLKDAQRRGMEIGIEKGRKEGREEGRVEGERLGKRKKALELARRMMDRGLRPEEVTAITGLSPEELRQEES